MELTSPESVGVSSPKLDRINDRMRGYVDGGKLAGALTMVARRDEVFHFQPHGVADLESGAPMERDTIFRLYSMTKPITTLAAMMLYEEGRFSLDDRVDRFIPELADMKVFDGMDGEHMRLVDQERPITIRHLLTHTAGLSYGFDPNNPVDAMYRERRVIDPDSDLREFAEKIGSLPLVCQPGAKWTYSLATTVLGYLAQVVSGQPLDELLRERVFTPLGMTDTKFFLREQELGRLATVYSPARDGGIRRLDNSITNRYDRPLALLSGGAGLVSTATDYMRFCQMLLNGGSLGDVRLVAPETVEMMCTDQLHDDLKPYVVDKDMVSYSRGCGFGFGFCVVDDITEHGFAGSNGMYFWFGLASCYFWIDPAKDLIAVLMTQFMPGTYYPLESEFRADVYGALIE